MDVGAWTLALDIGGTKLAAGLVRADGSVAVHDSIPTRGDGTDEVLYADLLGLADRVLATRGVRPADLLGVGVGCGGPMAYPEGRVSPLPTKAPDFTDARRAKERHPAVEQLKC